MLTISDLAHPSQSIAMMTDGKTLVSAGIDGVRWFDIVTAKELRVWQPFPTGKTTGNKPDGKDGRDYQFTNVTYRYVLSPKANFVVIQVRTQHEEQKKGSFTQFYEEEAICFDLATTQEFWRTKATSKIDEMHVAFSADEKRVAVALGPHNVELRETKTGNLQALPALPKEAPRIGDRIGAIALAHDGGALAFAEADGHVYVLHSGVSEPWRKVTARVGNEGFNASKAIAFSPDSKTLLVAVGLDLQRYELTTLKEVTASEGHRASIEEVAFSADGQRVLTGSAYTDLYPQELATWNVGTWKQLELSSTQNSQWPNIGRASFDHTLYVEKDGLNLYDMRTGKLTGRIQVPGKQPTRTFGFFSPNRKFFVLFDVNAPGADPDSVKTYLYSVPSCELMCQFPSLLAASWMGWRVPRLAFSADDQLVAMVDWHDGLINVVETATGKVRQRLGEPPPDIEKRGRVIFILGTLAFSPDGTLLASWSKEQPIVRIWDVKTGKERLRLPSDGEVHDFLTLAWSHDGRTLAVGDRKIQLFETASGKLRHEFTGHEGDVRSLAFSPDGRYLASGSTDTTVLIWDVWGK
jgi:WD40 repeat protein